MTDSQETSYYEIALTNRQVVVAFVILLVCLMGTFFAGVWVGRGESAAAPARTAEQAEVEAGEIEELDFFGGGDQEGQEGETAAPPPQREDPVVQRNRRQAAERGPAAGQDLAGGEGPALSEEAPRQPEVRQQPAPRESPPAQPRTETPPTPRPEAQPPARTEPAPPEGRLVEGPVVQVFSSSNREQAQAVVDRLTDGGQPAYLSPVDVEGQTMYRVRIGPFQDRGQAEKVADQVKRTYRLDTWITQ